MKALSIISILLFIMAVGCTKRAVITQPPLTNEKAAQETAIKTDKEDKPVKEEPVDKPATEAVEKITEQEMATEAKPITSSAMEKETKQDTVLTAAKKDIEKVSQPCSQIKTGEAAFEGIYFDFDSYLIKDASEPLLKEMSSWLSKNNIKITIEGHCDERGTNEYNMALGDQRAVSVKDFLMSRGIISNRIAAISCGEEKPLCAEPNEDCWSKNRRAHFVVIKGTDGETN